jgi:hypothetical protein
MRSFVFISSEGFTFQPGSESTEPDIENCQAIGFADGRGIEDAFRNLVLENSYLLETSYKEITGYEILPKTARYFDSDFLRTA